jgi:hypothetical protein
MLKLDDSMSQIAKTEGHFHNPNVGGSIPPPRYQPFTEFSITYKAAVCFIDRRGVRFCGDFAEDFSIVCCTRGPTPLPAPFPRVKSTDLKSFATNRSLVVFSI